MATSIQDYKDTSYISHVLTGGLINLPSHVVQYLEHTQSFMRIMYKSVKHGYARVSPSGELTLTIPWVKRFDTTFKKSLIAKGEQLLQKQQTRDIRNKITHTHVYIRGQAIPKDSLPNDIPSYLKQICYNQSLERTNFYSQKLGLPYNTLTIKTSLKTKRGSCSSKQNINLNGDLVHLEKEFLEYVIAHEVAHLKHKHHQASFRQEVERLYPNYKDVRKKLKKILFQ